jgi:putative ABC transport system permease protein
MGHDVRLAFRTLVKQPVFAGALVATLALGISAATVMFIVLYAAVLRPLPFADPDRLVMLLGVFGPDKQVRGASFPEASDWRTMNRTLEALSPYDETSLNLLVGTEAVRVDAEMVSPSYFQMLGVEAARGRTFTQSDDRAPDESPVVVISDALWRSRLGSRRDIVGATITLNDRPMTVVGVMPEGFAGLSFDTDVWFPSMMVSLTSARTVVEARGSRWLVVIGKLKDGVTLRQAQEDLSRIATVLERNHPDFHRQRGVTVSSLREGLLGSTGALLAALFGAVLLFLAIACANAAALQLARTTARRRELAVRAALGAHRYHLARQLLVETVTLGLIAGFVGALGAAWSVEALGRVLPDGALPRYARPAVDGVALAFALGASLLSSLLITVLPALASTRTDLSDGLKEGARAAASSLGRIRRPTPQHALVVAEIALAVTLLAAAGLMLRSLDRQLQIRVGFDADGVTVARLTLPGQRYTPEARGVFVDRLLERLQADPAVLSAAIATDLPMRGNSSASNLLPDAANPDVTVRYYRHGVTPDFFATLRIPVLRGRTFLETDRRDTPLVAVLTETSARRIWRDGDALGRKFVLGSAEGPVVEVVGIVADARFRDLTTDLAGSGTDPDVFFPIAQRSDRDLELALRSRDGRAISARRIQDIVSRVDGGLPVHLVLPLTDAVRQQTAALRFGSATLAIFSSSALIVAAVGLYGLIAYIVGRSRREIAVRLALGADASRVARMVVANAMILVGAGLLAGLAGAIVAARALRAQLFEVGAADPVTLASVVGVLAVASLAASALPAWRAARTAPHLALKAE